MPNKVWNAAELNSINTVLDSQEEMSALMETASSWHSGQTSALYSLVSTERVHNEEHRENLIEEIEREIRELSDFQPKFKLEETKSLQELQQFVESFKIE